MWCHVTAPYKLSLYYYYNRNGKRNTLLFPNKKKHIKIFPSFSRSSGVDAILLR